MTVSTDNAPTRGANAGRGIGAAVMALFGALWLYYALTFSNAPSWALYSMFAVAGVLVLASIQLIRSKQASAQGTAPRSRWVSIGFFIVFAIEIAAINRVIVLFPHWGLQQYMLAAICGIVGIHFLPLAMLFRARAYYVTAAALIAWPAIVIGLASAQHRDVLIGFGAGGILWATVLAILVLVRR
jgi:hypothetical protein